MGNTNTQPGVPYSIRYPELGDVANVPLDMQEMATDVARELGLKISSTGAGAGLQKKIIVQNGTGTPTGTFVEGDIVFMIPPGT